MVLLALSVLSSGLVFALCFVLVEPSESTLEVLSPMWQREFGLIETVQHLLLLGLAVVFFTSLRVHTSKLMRAVLLMLGAGFSWLLLEELDYFMHYYDYLVHRDIWISTIAGYRSLHNTESLELVFAVAGVVTASATLVVALVGSWRGVRWLYVERWPALAALVTLVGFFLTFSIKELHAEDWRQMESETGELAVYASWGFLVGGARRLTSHRGHRVEEDREQVAE